MYFLTSLMFLVFLLLIPLKSCPLSASKRLLACVLQSTPVNPCSHTGVMYNRRLIPAHCLDVSAAETSRSSVAANKCAITDPLPLSSASAQSKNRWVISNETRSVICSNDRTAREPTHLLQMFCNTCSICTYTCSKHKLCSAFNRSALKKV